MSILDKLKTRRADKPPRILIYGPPGYGKTTLASEFPAPVFLQVEDGTPGDVEITGFGLLKTYGEVMDAIQAIYENRLPFDTVVLDSVTAMQKLVFEETCARGDDKGNRKANIEDFGYGKGYVYAQRVWSELLEALNVLRDERNMAVVLVGHSKIERFDDPESVSYDRFELDLHDKSKGAIERDMDAILLLKPKISIEKEDIGFNKERALAKGGQQIWMHANPRPAYIAKNRYGIPDEIFMRGKGYATLAKHLPPFGGNADHADAAE